MDSSTKVRCGRFSAAIVAPLVERMVLVHRNKTTRFCKLVSQGPYTRYDIEVVW